MAVEIPGFPKFSLPTFSTVESDWEKDFQDGFKLLIADLQNFVIQFIYDYYEDVLAEYFVIFIPLDELCVPVVVIDHSPEVDVPPAGE